MRHWMRFNAVGLAGVFVQLACLHLFQDKLGLHYLPATVFAVEMAVLHNFWWHWKWTWRERRAEASSLLRFQCTTGVVSIAGNICGMKLLSGLLSLPALPANLLTIALLYGFNWIVNDRYVFRLR
jgi:dolichol-phosphate mannosyltransferase